MALHPCLPVFNPSPLSVHKHLSDSAKWTSLRIANLRYEEGETDLLDVLTIQQRVLSNEGDVVSIERAQLDEWIALNLALGGSWE